MITHMHTNLMGTLSFAAQFPGMRKAQEFIVYPMKDTETTAVIQSDTRIGLINLETGKITLTPAHAGGAYFHHLQLEGRTAGKLDQAELFLLKAQIMSTASGRAGSNGLVYVDNTGAAEVFK